MPLSEKDLNFIRSRNRFVRSWKAAATILLSALGLCLGWLVVDSPYLANPVFAANQLHSGLIETPTAALAVLMLPIVVLILFAVIAAFIVFGFVIIGNEQRYLEIIDLLRSDERGY